MTKKIGIISIKGGVGKTTSTSNLGAVFAKDFSKRVLIVDANFSAPNLALHVGIISPDTTIHDVLNGKSDINKAIHKHHLGFDVLPADLLGGATKMMHLGKVIKSIEHNYDVIVIDSSPNINDELLATIKAADELLVVTSPDYPTLYTTISAIRVARKRKTPIRGLILNKVRNKRYELTIDKIEEASEVPVLAVVPDDYKLIEAVAQTIPSTIINKNSDSTIEFRKLAACLLGEVYKDKRLKSRLKRFFAKGIPKHEYNRVMD